MYNMLRTCKVTFTVFRKCGYRIKLLFSIKRFDYASNTALNSESDLSFGKLVYGPINIRSLVMDCQNTHFTRRPDHTEC